MFLNMLSSFPFLQDLYILLTYDCSKLNASGAGCGIGKFATLPYINKNNMSNARYLAGYKAERRAKQTLEAEGYLVIRSAKSGSMFDLVAISPKEFRLVQIKLTSEDPMPNYTKEMEAIMKLKTPENTRKELWVWQKNKSWHFYPC